MNTEHRKILIMSGNRSQSLKQCQKILEGVRALWLSNHPIESVIHTPFKKASTHLGQESLAIVFDATEHFDANALGAVAGTLIGGGLLILLIPTNTDTYQHPRFIKRLNTLFIKHHLSIISSDTDLQQYTTLSQHSQLTPFTLTVDQASVVTAISNVAKGRRKRPLVITADRGRGKSSALGAAALALSTQGVNNIIVCAPAKAMVQPIFQHAAGANNLSFFAPDELDQRHPQADLVMIDEAGAIPIPLLTRLLQHYSRLVFSTTVSGYEGNGRGFALRFQDTLDRLTPNWRAITLKDPIRWAINDPLESFLNDVLLLNAGAATVAQTLPTKNLCYKKITSTQLAQEEPLLRQLFGLLVTAHYQTRPSDLSQLLDSSTLSIHTLMAHQQVVAVAVVSHEGGLDTLLTQQIFEGKRRPKGHLVPQILTFQSGIPDAASLYTDRIMRIAVHPHYQRQSLGRTLLSHICQQSTAHYLSTSFGLSSTLLKFWNNAGYSPIHLGLKREASSGYHSAVFIFALTSEGKQLKQEASSHFFTHFTALLASPLKNYEPSLVLSIFNQYPRAEKTPLSVREKRDIIRFSQGQCGYELVISSILRWLPIALATYAEKLTPKDAQLLIMRVLQHHDWHRCCNDLSITGKQAALVKMQKAIAILAEPLTYTSCSKHD